MAAKNDWTRLRDLFDRTANLDAAERARLLDRECGNDPDLRQQVEKMLAAHDAAGGFLTAPTEPRAARTLARDATDPPPGTIIGPYKLLQQIGEGGFGVVYMAEQREPIVRRVALKVIKLGMDTKQVIARFEAERQALALMDHPNIAHIFDAGATEAGRPYFVMELVHGVPVTEYCDHERLTTRQRLELFIPVCQAVAHAHQKGVIHRDLKPSNVLITLHDGVPVPKVIDFGIARAIHQRLTERTLFTEYGQLIGTPEYMSPEQAEMSGLDIDTRSDIYSLGALLYELLTGERLFDPRLLRSLALQEIQRVIREEEPPRPSARVSSLGVTATEIAHHRGVQAPQLVRVLRGDPDWIVVKAIAKDRRRRYDSAGALAEDIERALRSEPVSAGPPSRLYRLRKFTKRHRGPVAAGLAVMAAVLAFGSLALWQGQRARTEGLKAQANAILAAAAAVKDPLVKALLVRELEGLPGLGAGELSKAQSVLGAPLPVAVFDDQASAPPGVGVRSAALSPDAARVVIASWDGTARVWRADGTGEPVVLRGHTRSASSPSGGPVSLNYVGFSPDGHRVVTCGWDRTARIWLAEGGEPVVLRGHEDQVTWTAWSPDGTRLATASADGTARIWPTVDVGKPIVLRGHTGEVRRVSYSPDGMAIVTASLDGTARVWRADGTGAPVVLEGHKGDVTSAIFSPNGRSILTASDDGTARVWRADGTGVPIILRGHEGRVTSASFSPDGQRIVTSSLDRTARVWRTDGTGVPAVLDGHEGALWWAGFGRDGARIFTASEDGTARVWEPVVSPMPFGVVKQTLPAEVYRGRKLRFRAKVRVEASDGAGRAQLWVHIRRGTGRGYFDMYSEPIVNRQWREYEVAGEVADDAFSISLRLLFRGSGRAWMDAASLEIVDGHIPSGQGLIDGGFEAHPPRGWEFPLSVSAERYRAQTVQENPAEGRNSLRLDDERPRYASRLIANQARGIRVASFDAMGEKSLLTASNDGTARLWRTDGTGEPLVLRGHEKAVLSAAFSSDGQRIVTASLDSTVRVWRADGTGTPLIMKGHEGHLPIVSFSPDGQRIVSASLVSTAHVWRADGVGAPIILKGHEARVTDVSFSPDGQRIVTGSLDGTVRVWRADGSGEPLVLRGHKQAVSSAAFSPDGQRVVTASLDGTVRVWHADGTGEPLVLAGSSVLMMSAAFSPDGRRILAISADTTARVWRADGTGEPVVLRGHDGRIESAEFNPQSQRIVTGSQDGTVRVWRADGAGEPLVLTRGESYVSAAFSPDGQLIVTSHAGPNGTARVWRADGAGEPIILRGHDSWLASARFSPDGRNIVTASGDGTARVWRVTWDGLFGYLHANVALCLEPEERMQYLGESPSEAWRRYADCESRHGRTPKSPDAK